MNAAQELNARKHEYVCINCGHPAVEHSDGGGNWSPACMTCTDCYASLATYPHLFRRTSAA